MFLLTIIFFNNQLLHVTPNAHGAGVHVRVMDAVFVGGVGLAAMQPTSHQGSTRTEYW